MTYFEPVLSFRLSDFTDSLQVQSLAFCSIMGGYCIMGLIMPFIVKIFQPFIWASLGLLFCGFSNFLVGPSIFLPDNFILIIIGLFFSGATNIMFYVPQIPIMMKRIEAKHPNQTGQISDMCSSLFITMISIGQALGPIFGGYMTKLVGYRIL